MNLLDTPGRRRVLFTLLYASEGAPIGFLWWALPSLQRDAGVSLEGIGRLAALLVLPWSLKFLWAPLIDVARGERFGLRGWIVCSQTLMALTLLPFLWIDPAGGFAWLVPFLMAHAVAAATQDAAIDALAIESTDAAERGGLNGWMQAGMLAGRSLMGGGALIMAGWWGMRQVVLILIGWIAALLLVSLAFRPGSSPRSAEPARMRRFLGHLRRAGAKRSFRYALLFALIAGAGFEATGILAGPFLIDRGFGKGAVGAFYALPSVVAMIAGAIAGGVAADRLGKRRTVAVSLLALSASIAALAGIARIPAAGGWVWAGLSATYLGIGLFTAASYALFMDLTDPALGATQFSAFMGATNLCEAWAANLGGRLAGAWGYPTALIVMAVVCLPALLLLSGMRAGAPPPVPGGPRVVGARDGRG